jgi:hypothetical protein
VYLHFDSAEQAERALLAAGFRGAEVVPAAAVQSGLEPSITRPSAPRSADGHGGARLAHILEAST